MKITLFGLAGTGTTTTGREVATRLNLEFLSTGHMFRAQASKLELSVNELDTLSQVDPKYDRMLDEQIAEYGRSHDNFLIDSRMAWYFIPDSIKIKLFCDFDTRIARVAARDNMSVAEARRLTVDREQAIFDRYDRYYGVTDCNNDTNFDLIINTTTIPLEHVVEQIIDFIGQTR